MPTVLAVTSIGAGMMGVGNVTVTLLLVQESPAGRATAMTLNQAAFSVGSAVGGLLLALGGYSAIVVSVPLFCGSAALLIWLLRPRPVRGPARAASTG